MSVTRPTGFRAAGATAGLKASGRPDVALVVNDGPEHVAAAVFTSNRVQAAPVLWSRQAVADGRLDAVILNSGGANACTGHQGFQDTHATAEKVADLLGISAGDVAVCSTGLIGELLPMAKLLSGCEAVATSLSADGGPAAAEAIMTTDTVSKQASFRATGWSVGGMAKGAGMLAPGLATMLVVLTTDAIVSAAQLEAALRTATRLTFDRVDSDGCMSTNDTVIALASGASGIPVPDHAIERALTEVCADLAMQLVRSRSRVRSRGTTSSSARSSAATPTGAASWRQSAPPTPPSTRPQSTSPSTAFSYAARAASAMTAPWWTSPHGKSTSSSISSRATRQPPCGPTT